VVKKQPRIQHIILIWMIVLTIIPISVVSYQGYHCARQALIETQNAHLQAILSSKQAQVERVMDVVRSDLHLLSILSFSGVSDPDKGSCQSPSCTCNPLSEALDKKAYYNNLIAFNANWKLIGSARPFTATGNLPADFQNSLESASGLIFSNVLDSENGPQILAGCPLADQVTGKRGFITGTLNLSPIIRPILSDLTGLGKSGRILLVSGSGKTIQLSENTVQIREPDSIIQKLLHLPVKTARPRLMSFPETGKILVSSIEIPTLHWRMFLLTSYTDTFRWLITLRNRAILTGTIVFILVLFVAVRMTVRISNPMKILSETANNIASGQITSRVPPLPGREAAEVAEAFNRMLNNLSTLQQELAHSASLAAIGELSSSIVHEMRNPLSSVKMNLQGLREKVKDDPDYLELSDIALSQAARLENMLTELLGYGKPVKLNKDTFNLKEFIESCTTQPMEIAKEKNVKIQTELSVDEGIITGDKELLSRAIVNLLRNAIEAAPMGTIVTISTYLESGKLCFSVVDKGPGIPPAIVDEIFKPFITSKENGTGLGLANVKKIARLHSGSVSAENLAEGGARFVLCLPEENHQT